jgi:hypothetical protein
MHTRTASATIWRISSPCCNKRNSGMSFHSSIYYSVYFTVIWTVGFQLSITISTKI